MKIQEIPPALKVFFNLYGFLIGELVAFYYWLARRTCKIEIIHPERLDEHAVFVLWHGNLNFFFTFTRDLKKQVWLTHPYAYMMPYYYLLKKLGTAHISLGSTGSAGKKAALELQEHLVKGFSTLVAVDGPYGPAHEPKSGAFYFALNTQIPIYPMKFTHQRCLQIKTWDKKTFMIPFVSSIQVEILNAIWVKSELEIDPAKLKIKKALGAC